MSRVLSLCWLLSALPMASSQVLGCKAKCSKNKQSWTDKCVWKEVCGGCPECKVIRRCAKFCPDKQHKWEKKCLWSTCNGCPQCPDMQGTKKQCFGMCRPWCATKTFTKQTSWMERCEFEECCGCSQCKNGGKPPKGECGKDGDCESGHYCTSAKKCVKFDSEYCDRNDCGLGDGDCDSDDKKGCMQGFVCGTNNCAKFHQIGSATGMTASSDCCERVPPPKCDSGFCRPWCATKKYENPTPWTERCSWQDCCACRQCVTGGDPKAPPKPAQCMATSCKAFCASKPQPWTEKCSWKDCCACRKCPGGSADPPAKKPSNSGTNKPASGNGAQFPFCKSDKQCKRKNQFCATKCFTGRCGPDNSVAVGTKRTFCQPCSRCKKGADAVNKNCNKCQAAAKAMEMPAMVEISLLENVTVNSTTPFVDATESGDFVLKTGSDIAEEPNRTQTSGDADPVAAAAETDSVETGGLLSKLAITIATGWLIY